MQSLFRGFVKKNNRWLNFGQKKARTADHSPCVYYTERGGIAKRYPAAMPMAAERQMMKMG